MIKTDPLIVKLIISCQVLYLKDLKNVVYMIAIVVNTKAPGKRKTLVHVSLLPPFSPQYLIIQMSIWPFSQSEDDKEEEEEEEGKEDNNREKFLNLK